MIVCRYYHTDQPLAPREQASTNVQPSDVLRLGMGGGDVRVAVVRCPAVEATEAPDRMVLWVTEPIPINNNTDAAGATP